MVAMTGLQLGLCAFYGIYGLVFFVVLCATLSSHPLFPISSEDADWSYTWLVVTVADYYGSTLVLCGIILSSEQWPTNVFWALGCCLCGCPICVAWAISRLWNAEPHPVLRRTGLELFSTVDHHHTKREGIFMSDVDNDHISDLDILEADMVSESNALALEQGPVLSTGMLNPRYEQMEYAVRGALVARAAKYKAALASGGAASEALPFDELTMCNIGNPHALGQQPLSYLRQLIAGCIYPSLLDTGVLASDACEQAKQILKEQGMGAYSGSKGLGVVRQAISEFLEERDGQSANADHIFCTAGASEGIKTILSMVIRDYSDGVLIPIPQYPLYSAAITSFGGTQLGYKVGLSDDGTWHLDLEALESTIDAARSNGVVARALCVINPGNPTGQVLERNEMAALVKLCEKRRLVLLADEVYQANIYDASSFVSFKRVVKETRSELELASFHSVSKGVVGECGLRAGFMELVNFHAHALEIVEKMLSVSLCSSIPGQVAILAMVKPPSKGVVAEEDREERDELLASLRRRSNALVEQLNTLPGVRCPTVQGALYAFPKLTLPAGAVAKAKERGIAPDFLYCEELLDQTGICTVPGSGFGQEGQWHIRTTFLPSEEQMDNVTKALSTFHVAFLEKYGGLSPTDSAYISVELGED